MVCKECVWCVTYERGGGGDIIRLVAGGVGEVGLGGPQVHQSMMLCDDTLLAGTCPASPPEKRSCGARISMLRVSTWHVV